MTTFKQLYVASSAIKAWDCTLQIMVVDDNFLNGHIFDHIVLIAVTYDSNNNQNINCPMQLWPLIHKRIRGGLDMNWRKTFQVLMSLIWNSLRELRFTISKVLSEILDACLQDAWRIYLRMLRKQSLAKKEGRHSSMHLLAGIG